MDKIYNLKWNLEPGKFTKAEIEKEECGGCDAVILVSIVNTPDGGTSSQCLTLDGTSKEPLPDLEIFKAWVAMAKGLSESDQLGRGTKSICLKVFEAVRDSILGEKDIYRKPTQH